MVFGVQLRFCGATRQMSEKPGVFPCPAARLFLPSRDRPSREPPGRRGRLPVHAPLRTVLESFPSYGSSPHKARHILWPTRCLTRDQSRSDNLAILTGSRFTLCSFAATAPGRINRRASVVICFLGIGRFHWLSCHFRPDRRGHIQRITAGVGFFGPPKAAPPDPPCGEVCPVASSLLK
jgi:hypothetical protein